MKAILVVATSAAVLLSLGWLWAGASGAQSLSTGPAATMPPGTEPTLENCRTETLRIGAQSPCIALLRARLGLPGTPTFDQAMETVVRCVQGQANLDADGVVGPQTWNALLQGAPESMGCNPASLTPSSTLLTTTTISLPTTAAPATTSNSPPTTTIVDDLPTISLAPSGPSAGIAFAAGIATGMVAMFAACIAYNLRAKQKVDGTSSAALEDKPDASTDQAADEATKPAPRQNPVAVRQVAIASAVSEESARWAASGLPIDPSEPDVHDLEHLPRALVEINWEFPDTMPSQAKVIALLQETGYVQFDDGRAIMARAVGRAIVGGETVDTVQRENQQ